MGNIFKHEPRIIMFNGPKKSGKDTAVSHCRNHAIGSTTSHIKMAGPLYKGIESLFGITPSTWDYIYNNHKESPFAELEGMTPRETMIWLSEEVFKPKFGDNFFGKIAGRKTLAFFDEEPCGTVLMSDAGFNAEVAAMVGMVGPERCFLVRLKTDDSTFNGDSREYVDPELVGLNPKTNFFELYNTGTLASFLGDVTLLADHIESVDIK